MLSRRENLLLRPWQQRKYENHRRKVQSAVAVVDNRSPAPRKHVEIKMKQLQKEKERCQKIENDNLFLLRKLNHIMRTSRVDNNWKIPQPNFLNRVSVYKTKQRSLEEELITEHQKTETKANKRKLRCLACTPQESPPQKIPEERVPWEPVKLPLSKGRSKSVPVQKTPLSAIEEKADAIPQKPRSLKSSASSVRVDKRIEYKPKKVNLFLKNSVKPAQSVTVSRGSLKLAVNIPADAFVKFQCGGKEKALMGLCHCKRFESAAVMCQ